MDKSAEDLQAEVDYLLLRAKRAGCFGGDKERFVGVSSNAMVAAAIRGNEVGRGHYPADTSDLASCRRARNMAPEHLWAAMDAIYERYAEHVTKEYPEAAAQVDAAVPLLSPRAGRGGER